jgi:hypothetical protein
MVSSKYDARKIKVKGRNAANPVLSTGLDSAQATPRTTASAPGAVKRRTSHSIHLHCSEEPPLSIKINDTVSLEALLAEMVKEKNPKHLPRIERRPFYPQSVALPTASYSITLHHYRSYILCSLYNWQRWLQVSAVGFSLALELHTTSNVLIL